MDETKKVAGDDGGNKRLLTLLGVAALLGAFLGGFWLNQLTSFAPTSPTAWPWPFLILSIALGAILGTAELVSRYRDAPLQALLTIPSLLYIGLNAGASGTAFALAHNLDWFAGIVDPALDPVKAKNDLGRLVSEAFAAGLGAVALFRTSLMTVRVGNTDIGVGPAVFLQILLSAADRACDRTRASPRARAVKDIMADISFAKAKQALPTLCFGLMQNVSSDEQKTFGTIVTQLESAAMDEIFKSNILGLELMNLVGEGVLREAVLMLKNDISAPPRTIVQSLQTLQLLKSVQVSQLQALWDFCALRVNKPDQIGSKSMQEHTVVIQNMGVSDTQKVLLFAGVLIKTYGEDTAQAAIRAMTEVAPAQPANVIGLSVAGGT